MLTGERRPTAIFTASDTQALGVIAAARELGLHVPDDLSVIGYDDIEAADYVGLTTIRQQLFESGRRGAEILLAEIESRSERAAHRQVDTQSWWSARPRRLRRRAVDEGHGPRSVLAEEPHKRRKSMVSTDFAHRRAAAMGRAAWR